MRLIEDQRFLYASRKALEIWDKKPDDLIGVPFLSAFPNAVGTPDYEAQRRALETGTAQHFESVSPLIGHWFEVDIYPTSTGVSVALRDIDRRKQAEALLRASEARLQAAVDLVKLGRYAWNPQTNELQWDDTLRAMWGLLQARPSTTMCGGPAFIQTILRVSRLRSSGAPIHGAMGSTISSTVSSEKWTAWNAGSRPAGRPISRTTCRFRFSVSPWRSPSANVLKEGSSAALKSGRANWRRPTGSSALRWRNVSLPKPRSSSCSGSMRSGRSRQAWRTISTTCSGVVLTNARLFSRTVQRPDDQEGIELIRTAADRGAKLIAQLLAFSRQQRLEPHQVDLNSKIAGMGDLLSATLGGTVQLKTIFAPDLWPALVDPNQIEMIVLNLAINARDAMQSGGTLTLETFNTIIESESFRPEEPLPGDYVVLAVKDTGMGIPDDVLPHVFEPFFTTKEPGKGSGLGLAQVFGFAKQSGGGMRIELASARVLR